MFSCPRYKKVNSKQKTNGPVNAHLISGPTISTSLVKFDIVVK